MSKTGMNTDGIAVEVFILCVCVCLCVTSNTCDQSLFMPRNCSNCKPAIIPLTELVLKLVELADRCTLASVAISNRWSDRN